MGFLISFFADYETGAGLGFHIHFTDVLADDADTEQLDAADKAQDADLRGPAGYRLAGGGHDDGPDDAHQAQQGDEDAKIALENLL